jgi:hypothetical protein
MLIQKVLLLLCVALHVLHGQSSGSPPTARLGALDIYNDFHLPPVKDRLNGPLTEKTAPLSVVKRSRALGLNAGTALNAWRQAQKQFADAEKTEAAPPSRWTTFTGTTASALNRMLAGTLSIKVTASALDIDEPIRITQSGLNLDLGSTRLTADNKLPYMLRIDGAANVAVTGGEFERGDSAILVNGSKQAIVKGVHISDLSGNGIVVTHSASVVIRDNRIRGLGGAAILLQGGTASGIVEGNVITRDRGASNMTAAIVVSDRDVDLSVRGEAIFGPDNYWVISQPMMRRIDPPHNNLIVMNHLAGNAASGVYVDGAVATVIALNVIEDNAKEGICLDNGATANVVTLNEVLQNGNRWGETDSVMEKDVISAAGRLPNGTPAAKVPGISIDNAIYNIVFSNNIAHNFGGGIKMVRTGYFNVIGLNTILANNDGEGEKFHFFGIEMGAAPLDAPSEELDGTPSRGNIIFSNTIRGNHYAGIFFAAGSDTNDVFDNLIMDAEKWALESVIPMPNSSLNNFTNLATRNIGAGLSPALTEAVNMGNLTAAIDKATA